jgi:DNA-binding MarR family transcriptional regulator
MKYQSRYLSIYLSRKQFTCSIITRTVFASTVLERYLFEHKLNIEQVIELCERNWPQENLEAGPTTVRIIRAGDIMLSIGRKRFEQFNLTPAEFDTLATLRKIGSPHEAKPSCLCKANLLSSGGLTKVLNNLEQRGLITRQPDSEDKRSRIVHLSPEGLALIEEAMAAVLETNEKVFSSIYSDEERKQLDVLLSKFHHGIEKLF